MNEAPNPKAYDLEERTYSFAKACRDFTKRLPRTQINVEYSKQLIRSSGSVASNYIEANEALSKKDFFHRIKICRKEVKESRLWLRLCEPVSVTDCLAEEARLINEAVELGKIFGSILVNGGSRL